VFQPGKEGHLAVQPADSRPGQLLGVRERPAILLLDLARTHGEQDPEGVRLTTGLSQRELAGSVGASREAVARLLKDLRERGIVRRSRGLADRRSCSSRRFVRPAWRDIISMLFKASM
jgi:CRP-like cAMP-binding protein